MGSNSYRSSDFRVIAATHRDLHKYVNEGRFRADLLFRLGDVRIQLPPLRQRKDDIPLLVARIGHEIIATEFKKLGFAPEPLTLESIAPFQDFDWPGNVRELKKVVRAAFWTAYQSGEPIDIADALAHHREKKATENQETLERPGSWKEEIQKHGRVFFGALARDLKGNISKIAEQADVQRSTVRSYLGIKKPPKPKAGKKASKKKKP